MQIPHSMRVAVLDLGTNTFNLLIADVKQDGLTFVDRSREVVKLGEGGLANNRIGEAAFKRGLLAIDQHVKRIKKWECKAIKAVATSGIRSTSNGHELIETISKKHGIDVEIIDGDREAELIYKGVVMSKPIEALSLIMDIGGGSTEFILCDQHAWIWKQSFQLGAARLKENFQPEDPILPSTQEVIEEHINEVLQPLFEATQQFPIKTLIGSSGSFDTFLEMQLHRENRADFFESADFLPIDFKQLHFTFDHMLQSSLEERLQVKGLIPMRADMIVMSSILTQLVIEKLGIELVFLSKYALKEGLLSEFNALS